MNTPDLTFNFIGVCVVDWRSAFQFFSEVLGLQYAMEPNFGDWAALGGAWDDHYQQGGYSLVFELFDHGREVTERRWGLNQAVRPGLHVSNLQKVMERFDFPFTLENRPWGNIAEFTTTEGIRFALAEIPDRPFSDDLAIPYIGHVAIKCADFEAMQHFYCDVLGFTKVETGAEYVVLTQSHDHPLVILERGGSESRYDLENTFWKSNAVRAFPVFPSFTTTDLQAAYEHLRSNDVIVLREILSHTDWGGTDFHIADPDGNGIQIVGY
jgi:catechol 2,3-dioxygenase-like lactoylglutathione lyase family enzyme